MGNVWTITLRELKSYFVSPVAYFVSAFYLLVTGFLFALIIATPSASASLNALFSNVTFVLLIIAPALTMKLLADEQRMGTIELLLTSPVSEWQIVVGKFLGSVILFAAMLVAPTLYYVVVLRVFGSPDLGPILTGYLGVVLLGASFLSVGLLTSSLTQNQVIAYISGVVILLLMWIADAIANWGGYTQAREVLSYIAITRHYDNFLRGVIELSDVVFPLSVIAVMLFFTVQILQTRRWR